MSTFAVLPLSNFTIIGYPHNSHISLALQQAKYNIYDKNEPKFFVLTFILCGTVAAVVLVIIVVYVVQRHSRSREKLAQLASGEADDSVEASKDYQVRALYDGVYVCLFVRLSICPSCWIFLSSVCTQFVFLYFMHVFVFLSFLYQCFFSYNNNTAFISAPYI